MLINDTVRWFLGAIANFDDSTIVAGTLNSNGIAIEGVDVKDPTFGNDDYIYGSFGPDILLGYRGRDVLKGLAGSDQIYGGYGNDRLYGGDGGDYVYGEQENDLVCGGTGNDYLYGDQGSDSVYGEDGDDFLDGGNGADYMSGGRGNDTYIVDSPGDVIDDQGDPTDVDYVYIPVYLNYALPEGFTGVVLQGTANSSVVGNAGNNVIFGNEGNNQLTGGDGDDTVNGGGGTDVLIGGDGAGDDKYNGGDDVDTLIYTSATQGITVNLRGGWASGSQIDNDIILNVENLVLGFGSDDVTGDSKDNVIDAGIGAGERDVFRFVGSFVEYGFTQTAANTFVFTDSVFNREGKDTLSNFEEFLFADGAYRWDGTQFKRFQLDGIETNGSRVILSFSRPIDISGLQASALSVQTVSSTNAISSYTINKLEVDSGNPSRLIITLNPLNNLYPASMANLRVSYTPPGLNQGSGVIQDLKGNDLPAFSNQFSITFVSGATVSSLASEYRNITLTGGGLSNATGNAAANTILGNTAVNVISGGLDDDAMNGGEAGDIYLISSSAEHARAEITDSGVSGIDELRFASTTAGQTLYVFAGDTGLERVVIGTGAAAAAVSTGTVSLHVDASAAVNGLEIHGNAGGNKLIGTAYADVINGKAGTDTMNGGESGDLYLIASSADHTAAEIADSGSIGMDELRFSSITKGQTLVVYAGDTGLERVTIGSGSGATADTSGILALNINATAALTALEISGNAGINSLSGGSAGDVLIGNGGADTLNGRLGNDNLTGGIGAADVFRFDTALNGSTNVDTLTDFTPTEGDRIQLENTGTGVFNAITTTGTLALAAFVTGAAFTTAQQRIRYDGGVGGSGGLFYDPDGNGASGEIQFALLTTKPTLTNAAFVVT